MSKNVKLDMVKPKRETELTVEVIRIVGIYATVKGTWTRYEPSRNRYDVEVNSAMKTGKYERAIKEGKKVEVDIKFSNNEWYAKQFHIVEPEPEPTKTEIATQRAEYETLSGDY